MFFPALLISFIGSVVGMSISYSLGRYFGLSLLQKYGKRIGIHESHLQRAHAWYAKFGPLVLIVGYFVPGIRHVTAFSAGMSRLRISLFMVYAYIGGLLWALTFISLGRFLGDHWNILFVYLHQYGKWILAVILIVVGSILWIRRKIGTQS